ncbi:MAG: neuromedin U [Deltaproteobacteria bacterium]|nr:neuromedin U [Deltaproteobacteria bacterium]
MISNTPDWRVLSFIVFLVVLISAPFPDPTHAAEDLAKKSQNPISNLVSIPIEFWHYDGIGEDSTVRTAVLRPVFPVRLGAVNLINRVSIPYLAVDAGVGGVDIGGIPSPQTDLETSGLGNILYQGFFSPAKPSKVKWGLGITLELPTNEGRLGSDNWSAGPGVIMLTKHGKWVIGVITHNIWSFAGPSDEANVNKFVFQYFINYNLGHGLYLNSTPTITADWEKPSDQRWTVPFGGGIGKLFFFGKQPVDFNIQVFKNVEKPDLGAEWSVLFSTNFLFPK